MEKIFLVVLDLSYAGTWVIAAVLILRCLLYRLPKKFSYILWIIPGIRLLFPISFPGIWGIIRNSEAIDSQFMILQTAKAVQDTVTAGEGIDGIRLTDFVSFVLGLMGVFWAVGMGLLAGYGVFSLIRLKRKLQISVRWKENIYLADGILTPFVFIGFPNRIYLPSQFEKEELIKNLDPDGTLGLQIIDEGVVEDGEFTVEACSFRVDTKEKHKILWEKLKKYHTEIVMLDGDVTEDTPVEVGTSKRVD